MKTIISHFYNEEYLLPWWLEHHRKYFDDGIMINYGSTDNSVNIIKEYCPNWKVIDSRNSSFSASSVDEEVMDIESNISGWKIALNTTEFLIGDYNSLNSSTSSEIYIPCFYFIDNVFAFPNSPRSRPYSLVHIHLSSGLLKVRKDSRKLQKQNI